MHNMKTPLLALLVLGLFTLMACSSVAPAMQSDGFSREESTGEMPVQQPAPAAPAMPAQPQRSVPGAMGPAGLPGLPGNPGAPAPMPAQPAPAAPAPSATGGFGADQGISDEDSGANVVNENSSEQQQATLVTQQRIIVRTVDMELVVDEISDAIDEIADLTQRAGGWVVSSDRSSKHRGSVSIRVPADQLDESIQALRSLSVEVDSEVTSSQDVTDEYVDLTARLSNLEATEQALLRLLDRAEMVQDALEVQRELTDIQEGIERIQGRIKFLEETAAFSLINVHLRLSPIEMTVDAGTDQTYSVGQLARFRATFEPPEGIDEFSFLWDFGDGSNTISSTRTAPSQEAGRRVTTTVTHQYFDDRDSPFIVEVKITGTGDAGVAEGEDTILATVTRIPTIEVFAGNNLTTEEDEEIEFEGSFTRPQGLTELTYEWNFGDNTQPVTGSLEEGVTRAIATHAYADNRPFPYEARLTIKGQSEAGEVEATSSVSIFVRESQGFVISGWSAGDTGKTAIRSLSGVGQVTATIMIWAAIFSPVWIIALLVIYWLNRSYRNRALARGTARPAPQQPTE